MFGRRKDDVFLQLQQRLAPLGITRFYTDGGGAYERHLAAEQHQVGKETTQKIASTHINLRTASSGEYVGRCASRRRNPGMISS